MLSTRFSFVSLIPVVLVACGGKTDDTPTSDSGVDSHVTTDTPPVDGTPPDDAIVIPDTPAIPVPSDKVDLLFVVDNSSSMSDKQSELAKRVPELVTALTNPPVDSGRKAIGDLHVGVITSSLGSHGTSACDPATASGGEHVNDKSHLLPRSDASCAGAVTASALTWVFDSTKTAAFKGVAGVAGMQTATACVVASANDDGCGYEETLESMYRFLIEPSPYLTAEVACTKGPSGDSCGSNKIVVSGTDSTLLAERAAFLRPDSIVQVVILTDENDFSLKPAQLNWLPWGYGAGAMQRGWKACEKVDDAIEPETGAEYADLHALGCYSCFENTADPGGNCGLPWATGTPNQDADARNLRGFHMVQRFGYNFLYGRQRYVDGLTNTIVMAVDPTTGTASAQPNPLFSGGRAPGNVFVAAIVGVPVGLVGDATGAPKALTSADWDKIAGDATKRDPHMIESIAPRTALGIAKFVGDRAIDPVNGGDRDVVGGDDLQYACIGPRATDDAGIECGEPGAETKNPLCAAGGKQPYYKAYPALRHLRVVRELGENGLVASICSPSFSPVMSAIADKLQAALKSR